MVEQIADPETGEIFMATGQEMDAKRLEQMLSSVYDLRRRRDALAKTFDAVKKAFTEYLHEHPGEDLRDGETGTVARLTWPKGETVDVITLAKDHPEVLTTLAEMGLLTVDLTAFKRAEEKFKDGVTVRGYVMPKPLTARLMIEKERD